MLEVYITLIVMIRVTLCKPHTDWKSVQQWLVGQIPKLYVMNMESPTLVIFRYDRGWMHGHVPESLHYGYENAM